jgi:hypothetical protein
MKTSIDFEKPFLYKLTHTCPMLFAIQIEGLRVKALNTVLYSADFFEADGTNKIDERKKQMTWFANELKDAKNMGEKANMTMHIPPGINAFFL